MAIDWNWKDPRGVVHTVDQRNPYAYGPTRIEYVTGCNHILNVDDINKRTKVTTPPTCFRCAVAPDKPRVVSVE